MKALLDKLDYYTGDYVSLKTLATVAGTSIITGALLQLYNTKRNSKRMRQLRKEMTRDIVRNSGKTQSSSSLNSTSRSSSNLGLAADRDCTRKISANEEALIQEQLARNYAFLGSDGMAKLRQATVVVVGLGGVGSHAAHMLLRSGVMRLRLIDFDQVTLSSLNRHCLATQGDVGLPKTICLKQKFEDIFPWSNIEAITESFTSSSAAELISKDDPPTFVLDCIDNINTKIELIKYCKDNKIQIVSSMGSGAKLDPSRVQIADISDTFEDPLARAVRSKLRLQGIHGGVPVVYSTEKPSGVKLLPLDESKVAEAREFSALDGFRVRILPVLGPIPAMFGMAMAGYVISEISGFSIRPLAIKGRAKVYERMWSDLCAMEAKHGDVTSPSQLVLSMDDAIYLFEEVFAGKSFLTHKLEKTVLVRWNNSLPISFSNVVCLTRSEAQKHFSFSERDLTKIYGAQVSAKLKQRLDQEEPFLQLRPVPPLNV